jgi:chloramphenicol 3-O-phosphotransferase
MSVTVSNLIPAQSAVAAQTTYFTTPVSTRIIIDKLTATNTGGAAATVSLNIINGGGSAGASNLITSSQTIAAGAVYQFPEAIGHVMEAGQSISINASVTDVTLRASGRVIV